MLPAYSTTLIIMSQTTLQVYVHVCTWCVQKVCADMRRVSAKFVSKLLRTSIIHELLSDVSDDPELLKRGIYMVIESCVYHIEMQVQ